MDPNRLVDDERITTFGRLIEAHARLVHVLGQELEESVQIPLVWYGVLLHVARSPNGVRPMGELINATAFTSGGVTRLVDRMEQAALVERRPCPTDRRVQWISLTDAGRKILHRATEVHLRGIQEHMIDPLGREDAIQLDRTLEKLLSSE